MIHYGEKLVSINSWCSEADAGRSVRPGQPGERWGTAALLPGRGDPLSDPSASDISEMSSPECCYLTAGIRTCSPAGLAALAH